MLLNRIDRLLRLDSLISKGSTGTPTKLATKLNLSVRQVYRIIKELQELGAPVYYNYARESYLYEYKGRLLMKFQLDDFEQTKIRGGINLGRDNICQYDALLLLLRYNGHYI
jgi:predicted DNA-binding transcriptional regulator YafY